MRLLAILCTLVLAAGATLSAQQDPSVHRAGSVDVPLLEQSRIFRNVPNDHTREVYEGLLALHFPLSGGMQDSYDRARMNDRTDWAWLPSISMIVNLRQTVEESAPVRTPSYMPRVRLTAVRTSAPKAVAGTHFTASRQLVLDGTFGHYSNGQDGCPFAGQDATRACAFPAPVDDSALVVNRKDGSFSSHYLEAGAAWRRLLWGEGTMNDTRIGARSIVTVFTRVRDYKAVSRLPGGMEPDLRRLYGSLRVRAGAEYLSEKALHPVGRWWIGGWVEASNGHAPKDVTRWRMAAEAGKTFDRIGGTGVFARWYYGHDDYNLGFLQHISVLQVGLTLGGERRPTYRF